MMSRLADLAVSTTFAGSLLLANTSCATRHPDGAATSAPRSETQVPGAQRLVFCRRNTFRDSLDLLKD